MLNYASKYPTQTTTPDGDYPLGGAQNVVSPGDGTGTPWDVSLINDILGFFQALVTNTSITVSGNAETAVASDLWDAIDSLYALYNANKLIANDAAATPGAAEIGKAYQGEQYYGRDAVGAQSYGHSAIGDQFYGYSAPGDQYYGRLAIGAIYYGLAAAGDQFYGHSAIGDQYYGLAAVGAIEIGSTLGSAATKKLISGTKEATFEEIIDSATEGWGAWQTISYENSNSAASNTDYRQSLVCRKSTDGKNVQISGSLNATGSTSNEIGTLPSGYRPLNRLSFACAKAVTADASCIIIIEKTTGSMLVFDDDDEDVGIEVIIPLD